MSNTFIGVRSVLLLACLLVLCHSTPITVEVSTSNSNDEKEGIETSSTESGAIESSQFPVKATEGNHFDTLQSSDGENTAESKQENTGSAAAVPPITNGESEAEASKKRNSKRDACRDNNRHRGRDHDDDDDDDDDDEREERGEALLRSFAVMYERAKRAFSGGESEGESATQSDNAFVDHVLDYSLDRKKREEAAETNTKTVQQVENGEKAPIRKKRQSGETVPYIVPNRSRREESSFAEEEKGGEQSERRIKDEEEAEEEEEEEEEEKKEEFDEKLAMDS